MSIDEILKPKSDDELLTDLISMNEPDNGVIIQKLQELGRGHLIDEYLRRYNEKNK
jgi:hypothetical protein